MSWLFASGCLSVRASGSASVLPMNIHGWFPLGLTDLIFLQSKGLSRVFSSTTIQKHHFFGSQSFSWSNFYIHTWLLKKKKLSLIIWIFAGKVMHLLFIILFYYLINYLFYFTTLYMLSMFVIAFFLRRKHLLISLLQSLSSVTLEPKRINLSLFPLFTLLFAMKWWDWMLWS